MDSLDHFGEVSLVEYTSGQVYHPKLTSPSSGLELVQINLYSFVTQVLLSSIWDLLMWVESCHFRIQEVGSYRSRNLLFNEDLFLNFAQGSAVFKNIYSKRNLICYISSFSAHFSEFLKIISEMFHLEKNVFTIQSSFFPSSLTGIGNSFVLSSDFYSRLDDFYLFKTYWEG